MMKINNKVIYNIQMRITYMDGPNVKNYLLDNSNGVMILKMNKIY